ncbi:hypothetical protein CEXT_94391 [Caerostris extrusa]|uniref:Uncharacterized protein n=1 Tax=Caerostris extrusa TaxID=172846 RepID=A0AAV4Y0L8_CAEEX|nr:hypothetical protein CEXT_94391 [Caerostris extrusa]
MRTETIQKFHFRNTCKPRESTQKKLFACAFPGVANPLFVDGAAVDVRDWNSATTKKKARNLHLVQNNEISTEMRPWANGKDETLPIDSRNRVVNRIASPTLLGSMNTSFSAEGAECVF